MFLGNILLAMAWAALRGDVTLGNLAIGFLLGFAVLTSLSRGGVVPPGYGMRILNFVGLVGFFVWELVIANMRVALDVLRPTPTIRPAVITVPLEVTTDEEILLLSALINITPGSVTIDLSDDRKILYVHVMHIESPEQSRREIKDGYERRIMKVFE